MDITSRAPLRVLATAAVLAAAALTGCGGGSSSGSDKAAAPAKPKVDMAAELKKPATITWWAWTPGLEKQVSNFEARYPNIKVKLVNAGQGPPAYTKLRTALKAGKGAPDVAQLEFSYLPTFSIGNNLLDLVPYGANDIKSQFSDFAWAAVSKGNQVIAIPQDTGPMGMLYRKDIFDKYDIPVPKTWAEFATAAKKLHEADPTKYLTNLPTNDIGNLLGLMQQAGSHPFSVKSQDTVGVNLTDAGAKKWASFWTPLVQQGVVSTDAGFNNAWFRGFTSGKYATWLAAAWGPGYLQGTAKSTSGKWRAAPLPQWAEGQNVSGNWGGSTAAVIKSTKYPAAAAAFAQFINTDQATTRHAATKQFLFPPTKRIQQDPAFVDQKPEFYGGQQVNKLFSQIANTVPQDFQWNPFEDYVSSQSDQILGGAMRRKQDLNGALATWQGSVVKYAKQQGFKVEAP